MKTLLLLLLLILGNIAFSQDREMAIGLRMGGSSGFFFDIDNKDFSTIRLQLSDRNKGQQFSVLKYQRIFKHEKLPADFSFYFGFGAHAGYVKWDMRKTRDDDDYRYNEYAAPVLGLDGLVGVSYHLEGFPVVVSLEAKPYFDIWGKSIFSMNPFDFGFNVAYIF
jgi:hypothetical protein